MTSILEPSQVVLSPVHPLLDFAMKLPMTAIKRGLVAKIASWVSLKLFSKEIFKVIFRLVWRPFYHKGYTFTEVLNIG